MSLGSSLHILLVRHGEVHSYATDAALTALGIRQAENRGQALSETVEEGQRIKILAAPTMRAVQTAEHLKQGLASGLASRGCRASLDGPEIWPVFRNFQIRTTSGLQEPTPAFAECYAMLEQSKRSGLTEIPGWVIELDRFFRTQKEGGDPIGYWMQVPLLHFEPPALTVGRFCIGFKRVAEEVEEGTQVICVTHSGPMCALASWAFGYGVGEPENAEVIHVAMSQNCKSMTLTYRKQSQEMPVPGLAAPGLWLAFTD